MTTPAAFDVHSESTSFERYIRLWLYKKGDNATIGVKPVAFECETEDDRQYTPPTFEFDRRTAQNLMDALWSVGLRPANGEGTDAQVTAIKEHLSDMRKLVFEPRK